MGIAFSSPFDDFDDLDLDLEGAIETVLLRSFSFDGRDAKDDFRSLSFNGRDSEPHIVTSFGSGRMIFEGSLSFKGKELKTTFSFKRPTLVNENDALTRLDSPKTGDENGHFSSRSDSMCAKNSHLQLPGNHRYSAAVRLQKVYKSFRTRRQLADCAVLVEQKWWKLLDFAELKRSSVSFFEIERPESAVSRWSRARMRAAKVGKGLSKDEKARKLALQHWLEAIDPRHRYGHNLQFYYIKWLHCESKQPFFYWLDIGEGKEVNLLDRCPRTKLQTQCIKYLGPAERKAYEVVVEDGKFRYKQSGKFIDTREAPVDTKWIFVLSTSKRLYIGQKIKGTFQHSSFLAGGATLSAGRLEIEEGALKAVWPHSGHYLPTEENYQEFMAFLREHNVDLTNVQENPIDQEESHAKKTTVIDPQNHAEADLATETNGGNVLSGLQENKEARQQRDADRNKSRLLRLVVSKLTKLKPNAHGRSSSEEGYESAEESFWSDEDFSISKSNLFDEEEDKDEELPISKEEIMQRIDSHKGMNSYQLAKNLTSKWSTGAGPRISCMRDYPSELQVRVLEQANLSPRSSRSDCSPRSPSYTPSHTHSPSRFFFSQVHSPLSSTPTSLGTSFRSPLGTETRVSSPSSPTAFCRETSGRTTMGAEKKRCCLNSNNYVG